MNKRIIWFANFWFPVLLCMYAIFQASSMPGADIPSIFPFEDILFHGGIYAILVMFFIRALRHSLPAMPFLALVAAATLFGFIYGATDEFHQLFTAGRSCSGFDLVIDTAGAFIGSMIGGFLKL